MKWKNFICGTCFLVFCSLPITVWSQLTGEEQAELVRTNIVKIKGDYGNGYGFMIGQDKKNIYIVSANHVIRGDKGIANPKSVKVYSFSSPTPITGRYMED